MDFYAAHASSADACIDDNALTDRDGAPDRQVITLRHALEGASAQRIIRRALTLAERPIVSSSFGPDSAALLRLVHDVRPDVPVVWVDTGHHTPATHRHVESIRREWDLDLRIYRPRASDELPHEPPQPGSPAHAAFAEQVKLEPFRRALRELAPDVWLTGIRAHQTAHRRTLSVVERGPGDVLKIAPLLRWDKARTAAFLHANELPNGHPHDDGVKGATHLECGLHDRM